MSFIDYILLYIAVAGFVFLVCARITRQETDYIYTWYDRDILRPILLIIVFWIIVIPMGIIAYILDCIRSKLFDD